MSGVMTSARRGLMRSLAVCASIASMSLAASSAHAGPDEEAKSRNLFKQAESLANDGRWKEACHLYQAAHDLNSTGGTALRAADCYEKIADYEHALAMYRYVVDHRAKDKLAERVRLAEGRVFALEKQLAKDSPRQGPVQQFGPSPKQPPPPPPPVPNRIPAFVTMGVGGASLVAGVVLGSLALVQAGDIKSKCGSGDTCSLPQDGTYRLDDLHADKSALNAKAWAANVTLGVGIVGLAVGVTLYVLKVPKYSTAAATTSVGPNGVAIRF